MKQYEAVINVMEGNGGYATLAFLYKNVLKIRECQWKTKTPFASIRRIVQDKRFFFKIKPWLWALNSYKHKLPIEILPTSAVLKKDREIFNHSYYQGLLLEIGNFKKYETYVPAQDKNRIFLNKKLCETATLQDFYNFSYEGVVQKAKTIDVSWFNERKMPSYLFEIEYSTDFNNSLLKFLEIQGFNVKYYIVSDNVRKQEFLGKISSHAFLPIKSRVIFIDYDKLSEWHTKSYEIAILENELLF